MKKNPVLIILVLVFCFIDFSLFCYAEDVKEKKNRPVVAESVKQLAIFIVSALKDSDFPRLKQIKTVNNHLIRENKLLSMQLCSTLLNEAIEYELSDQIKKGDLIFQLSLSLAEIYHDVTDSIYLLDKVTIFRKWSIEEMKIYQKAETLYGQGKEFQKRYKHESAAVCYDKSLSLYRKIGYKEGVARCLRRLGDVYRILYGYEKALQRYEQGLEMFREIKDLAGEADCLQNLGNVHRILSEYEKASHSYEQALVIYRYFKHRLGESSCLQNLGKVHLGLSDYENALQRYEQEMEIYREIKSHSGQAKCLKRLGDVHMKLYAYEKALQRYEQGLEIFRRIKDRSGEARSLQSLGDAYRFLDEVEKARQLYEQGLEIFVSFRQVCVWLKKVFLGIGFPAFRKYPQDSKFEMNPG